MHICGFEGIKPAIVIPDVHGTLFWKDFVAERRPDDRVIFLGDYFLRRGHGSFAKSEAANFLEIVEYARKNPDTFLLMGNHDFEHTNFTQYESWDYRPEFQKEEAMRQRGDAEKHRVYTFE